ncbi:MAG: alkaline phosphatase family protein [Pseudomonadota bacterium]
MRASVLIGGGNQYTGAMAGPCHSKTRARNRPGQATSRRASWLLASVLLLLASWAAGAPSAPIVVLLSWDGVRHDFPDRAELPALERMARQGVRAGRLIPVFPSNTFPTHVSLATGTRPDRHGIIDNVFIDRQRGRYHYDADADWIDAEPLWIAAERQGVPAATYFWVGSESDWRGQGTSYRVAPFDGDRPEADKVDRILEWLSLPAGVRPRLVMSYWAGVDSVGHDRGPDSAAVVRRLRAQDRQLERLLDGIEALGLWRNTTVVVVSDHGMTGIGRYLDLRGALEDAGVSARVTGGAVAQVYLDQPERAGAALAALETLEPARIYRKEALPEALRLRHPHRTGDLVAVTEPPNTFSRPPGVVGHLASWLHMLGMRYGGHGYDPAHPDMAGIFYAMGRGVSPNLVLPEVQQVDVAATVAQLLEIDPPRDSEGRPVPGIGGTLLTRESKRQSQE